MTPEPAVPGAQAASLELRRVSKRFVVGDSALEAYLDVQNVTNRPNPEEIVYSLDYSQRRYITGLPLLPVAGARWSW